jgi:hypothetical protein
MTRAYVVTEGDTDAKILRRLLPEELIHDVKFAVAGGRSAAESLARSLRIAKQVPVALVFDTDTTDEQSISEQREFLDDYLDYGSGSAPFEVFPAVPEIEAVFFEDRTLVERATNREFSDLEWRLAKGQPKQLLRDALPDSADPAELVLDGVDEGSLESLRRHPLLQGLGEFLSSVLQDSH